jgi:hypothetical protein
VTAPLARELLVSLALSAPHCALVVGSSVLHAVTLEGLLSTLNGEELMSACGKGVKVLPWPLDSENPIPWPPAVKGPFARCRECWVATGKKRPASHFERKDPA